jgi:hypothetical protein
MIVGPSTLANTASWSDGFIGVVDGATGAGLGALSVALQDANTTSSTQKLAAIAANPNFDGFVVCGHTAILATDLVTDPAATAGGGLDIVVAKVTVTGSGLAVSWARQIGGIGNQQCNAIAVDDSGNVVITGIYFGQLDFGGGVFSPAGAANVFLPWIARLSGTDGHTLAAINIPPAATGAVASSLTTVNTDSAGGIAIAGSFRKGLVFGATTLTSASIANSDAFAAKFDSSLAPVWAKSWGNSSDPNSQSIGNGIAFDSSGNITLIGSLIGSIKIGPSSGILTAATGIDDVTGNPTNNPDVFVARLSGTDGSSLCAARFGDLGGQTPYGLFVPRSASGSAKDSAFVSGSLTSTLDFGTASLSTEGGTNLTYFWLARF